MIHSARYNTSRLAPRGGTPGRNIMGLYAFWEYTKLEHVAHPFHPRCI